MARAWQWEDHVRAIRAAPDDDAPRRACAAWLRERGDPRADVIEESLGAEPAGEPGSGRMHREAAAWLERGDAAVDAETWLAPVRALGATRLGVEGGFVVHATLTGRHVAGAGVLCRLEPIRRLSLASGGPGPFAAAAAAPELAGIEHLAVGGRHPAGAEAVLASPHLRDLGSLSIDASLTPALAEGLARGTARPLAVRLQLIDRASAARLAGSDALSRVHQVDVARSTDDGVGGLAGAPLADLRRLSLWESPVELPGWTALADRLDQLEDLALSAAPLPDDAVRLWIDRMPGGRLRRLAVAGAECPALAELVASPVMAGIEKLELGYGALTPEIAAALTASPHRQRLRDLWIPGSSAEARRALDLPGVDVNAEGW